ncbi:MAG: glycosyltransferase [Desulfovibrionaceae bacterium]|nr:glycosyltransferase [Desulfovibrionaceae bacterium]
MNRPLRFKTFDFSGRNLSLSNEWSSWQKLKNGSKGHLLLGLGPSGPILPPELLNSRLYFYENADFEAQTQNSQKFASWQRLNLAELGAKFAECTVWFYRPNWWLKPLFWGRLLGELFALGKWKATSNSSAPVVLGGSSLGLVYKELSWAFKELGFTKQVQAQSSAWEPDLEAGLTSACEGLVPYAALFINGEGLDDKGRLFYFLQASKVPLAIWFVDNPWHILSRLKLPWWKEATLLVTDPSFIPSLRQEGAKEVHFLPLASAPHMWRQLPKEASQKLFNLQEDLNDTGGGKNLNDGWNSGPPLFVGRLAFPAKEQFFAAAHVPKELLALAQKKLELDEVCAPHIHWWYALLKPKLWPGYEARVAGAGAEWVSQRKRLKWLALGLKLGFKIMGDLTWLKFWPDCPLLTPVDYYDALPDYYYRSSLILNVTSLQLPSRLSQRHFDVWAAGGFLLSDATSGLEIFPKELTIPITLKNPKELESKMRIFTTSAKQNLDLRIAWRQCLKEKHLYTHRVKTILTLICK